MQNNIQSYNAPSFGTNFGPRLTKFIKNNEEYLTKRQLKNIEKIKNNGSNDTTLEIQCCSTPIQKMYVDNLRLNLTGGIVDEKNNIMRKFSTPKDIEFQDRMYKQGVTDRIFPNYTKSIQSILTKFSNNELNNNIERELKSSKKVVSEYKNIQ